MSPNTPSNPEAVLDAFAEKYWPLAAKHAWSMYQRRGRGAVVVRAQPGTPSEEREPLRYLTFRGTREDTQGSGLEVFRDLVDSYDPNTEIVLAIRFAEHVTVVDTYGMSPPPPECS